MTVRFFLTLMVALSLVVLGQRFATAADNQCNGTNACTGNSGRTGNDSCNGDYACYSNAGRIRNYSCNGFVACEYNDGPIGNNSCNEDLACYRNEGKVGDTSCPVGLESGSAAELTAFIARIRDPKSQSAKMCSPCVPPHAHHRE